MNQVNVHHSEVNMTKEFFVKPDHIKLMKASNVRWEECEFGAASIDCKRPYGNSSVYEDIAELLGITRSEESEYTDSQLDFMAELHAETETCLQILLSTLSLKVGKYVLDKGQWTRESDNA